MKKLLKESLNERLARMDKLANSESAVLRGGTDELQAYPQYTVNLPPITSSPNPSYKIKPAGVGITYRLLNSTC